MLHRNLQTHHTGRGFSLRLILMYYSLHCHFLIFFILCHDRSSVKEFFLSVTKHPSNFFLYPAVGNKKPSTTGLCSGRIKGPKGGMEGSWPYGPPNLSLLTPVWKSLFRYGCICNSVPLLHPASVWMQSQTGYPHIYRNHRQRS